MQTVEFDGAAVVAAVLGGSDRKTLLACVTDDWRREGATTRRRRRSSLCPWTYPEPASLRRWRSAARPSVSIDGGDR